MNPASPQRADALRAWAWRPAGAVPRLPAGAHSAARLIAVLLLLSAGCRLPPRLNVSGEGVSRYRRVHVVYDATQPLEHGRTTADVNVRAIGPGDDAATTAVSGRRSARLEVTYPHPHNDADQAQVVVSLTSIPGSSATAPPGEATSLLGVARTLLTTTGACPGPEEVRTLDLTRAELDLLLADLTDIGYFSNHSRPRGGALLAVRLNHRGAAKPWSSEARLDELIERALQYGRPVEGFVPEAGTTPPVPPAAVRLASASRDSVGSSGQR